MAYTVTLEYDIPGLSQIMLVEVDLEQIGGDDATPDVVAVRAELDGCRVPLGDTVYNEIIEEAIAKYYDEGGKAYWSEQDAV